MSKQLSKMNEKSMKSSVENPLICYQKSQTWENIKELLKSHLTKHLQGLENLKQSFSIIDLSSISADWLTY